MENTYATLDEALTDIAKRSFYEAADVIPNEDGTYTVRNSFDYNAGDEVTWTYAHGLDAGSAAMDYSRLHDAAEFYETAAHIRFNLSGAVSELESGARDIHFEYAIVQDDDVDHDHDEDGNAIDPDTGELADDIAGWALIAYYA